MEAACGLEMHGMVVMTIVINIILLLSPITKFKWSQSADQTDI